jgi:hypothetical protein
MRHLADANFRDLEISVVVTRQNAGQLDNFEDGGVSAWE